MSSTPLHATRRWMYTLLGWIFTALGVVGMLLPVMPTTVFLLLALACFSRGSPRLENWLLRHPRLGPPLQRWRENGIIPRRAKLMAGLGMSVGFLLLASQHPPRWVLCTVSLFLLASLLFILSRPGSKKPMAARRKALAIALICAALGLAFSLTICRVITPSAPVERHDIASSLRRSL